MKRVVITGIGAVTPLGNTFIRSWEEAGSGRPGIGFLSRFDASRIPWKTAGELRGFDPGLCLSPKETRRLDPFAQYAVAASVMAAEDSGLLKGSAFGVQRSELKVKNSSASTHNSSLVSAGVIIGSSRGGVSTIEREIEESCLGTSRISPYAMPSSTVSMAASSVAQKLGIKGHCLGISNACASGTNAIGEAFRLVRSGRLGIALAGGSEAPLCRLCVEGYGIAGALSRRSPCGGSGPGVPKPFDTKRDGFVLGEGASVLVLEDIEGAVRRNAKIYAEVAGYGNTTDAFHMTKPDPGGEARAMMAALKEAGLAPDEVGYVNTHGTGTEIGDITESQALRMLFGKRAATIPASAAKSLTGHMLAASGAFETALTAMTLREGVIPPTINMDEMDPLCDINIVTERRNADMEIALTNSFGFGGVNAVLVLRRYR